MAFLLAVTALLQSPYAWRCEVPLSQSAAQSFCSAHGGSAQVVFAFIGMNTTSMFIFFSCTSRFVQCMNTDMTHVHNGAARGPNNCCASLSDSSLFE